MKSFSLAGGAAAGARLLVLQEGAASIFSPLDVMLDSCGGAASGFCSGAEARAFCDGALADGAVFGRLASARATSPPPSGACKHAAGCQLASHCLHTATANEAHSVPVLCA